MCIHCLVSGHVQGVWFRASAKEHAVSLGLSGWVRNLADGRVELVACGAEAELGGMREWLKQGPELARVSDVSCRRITIEEELEGFTIR